MNLSGDESDEEAWVGAIRIRDFSTIKEISEDEEDDDNDVVEIPQISTVRVRLEDEPESATDIHLDCGDGEEPSSVAQNRESALKKFLDGKRKLLSLQNYIRDMPDGMRVLKGADMLQNVSQGISNQGRLMSTGRGYSAVPRQSFLTSLPGNCRRSSARTPVSVVRGRPVTAVSKQNGGAKSVRTVNNSSGKPMNMVNMGGIQSLTQLIFDPATGFLLCPSPGGGTTMQALRPSMQALQSIQMAPRIACNRLNAPGPVQMSRISVARTPIPSIASEYVQSMQSRRLRAIRPATSVVSVDENPVEVIEGGGSGPPTNFEADTDPVQVIAEIESMTQSPSTQGAFTTIDCRSVRIGDYNCVARRTAKKSCKVVFAKKGILFSLPHAQNENKMVKCAIPGEKILKVMAHIGHWVPVIFIQTRPDYATWLRKQLGLSDVPTETNYFCSLNGGKCQKYITFLADKFTYANIKAIKQIYGNTLHELDNEKANELLMSIRPE